MPGLVGRNSDASSMSFQDDMITVTDRLPTPGEYRRVRHLDLSRPLPAITEDDLAKVLQGCPHLETVVLGGVSRAVSDRILTILADTAINLLGLDIYGCKGVTDAGLNACMSKSLPLQSVRVNGVARLTDAAVEAVAKTCSRLTELELCDLPGLTNTAVRDIWLFSRKLRTLRLANDPLLSDHAFPAAPEDDPDSPEGRRRHSEPKRDKPLPRRPMTWAEDLLPPLILRHTADNLRVLDLTQCQITDEAVEGIVCHAPRLQTFILSGCAHLTDSALYSIAKLGDNLDVLMLAHVPNITDRGVVNVARSCTNLRCVDVSFCRNLTDMSVFELAALPGLRRLSLVRVQKLTDIGLYSLAEHASELERLHLSYCDRLSLDAMHLLLRKLQRLEYFAATGVPCMRRKGIQRFSETTPKNYAHDQAAAFCVFSGEGVRRLRQFLDKEEKRRREAEAQNVPFVMREDDGVSLY